MLWRSLHHIHLSFHNHHEIFSIYWNYSQYTRVWYYGAQDAATCMEYVVCPEQKYLECVLTSVRNCIGVIKRIQCRSRRWALTFKPHPRSRAVMCMLIPRMILNYVYFGSLILIEQSCTQQVGVWIRHVYLRLALPSSIHQWMKPKPPPTTTSIVRWQVGWLIDWTRLPPCNGCKMRVNLWEYVEGAPCGCFRECPGLLISIKVALFSCLENSSL